MVVQSFIIGLTFYIWEQCKNTGHDLLGRARLIHDKVHLDYRVGAGIRGRAAEDVC
jgi:hypothetical protein